MTAAAAAVILQSYLEELRPGELPIPDDGDPDDGENQT